MSSTDRFKCKGCSKVIDFHDDWGSIYDNEQYYPHTGFLCPTCKSSVNNHIMDLRRSEQ